MIPVVHHDYQPTLYYGGKKPAFSVVPLHHLDETKKETFPSVSACLTAFYQEKAEQDAVKQKMHNPDPSFI